MLVENRYGSHAVSARSEINRTDFSGSPSFASMLEQARQPAPAKVAMADSANDFDTAKADFTRMTRKQMFDWVNQQIKSGKMTLDESTPFITMTVRSDANGQPVDVDTDTEPMNFINSARGAIDGARWRNDAADVQYWSKALESMLKHQRVSIQA